MLYYGTKISPNISIRQPEGYLICKDVPIARTGSQDYLADQLGLKGDSTRIVKVYRDERDVFDPACMASFEGLPFTDNHPSDEVTTDNISYLQKGHVQNIRRGVGEHANEVICDIIVTDPMVISQIQNGKREISCGYNFVLDQRNGQYFQRQIRGNHVALVEQGRAGHHVCIKDHKIERSRSKMANPSILARMFASFARDEDTTPEEIAEAADEIQSITVTTDPNNGAKGVSSVPGTPENTTVEDDDLGQPDKADEIIDLLKQLLAAKTTDAAAPEETGMEPLDNLQKELDADPVGPAEAESRFVDPEEINEADEDVADPDLMMDPTEDEDIDPELVADPELEDEDVDIEAMEEIAPAAQQAAKPVSSKDRAVRLAIDAIKPYIASLPKEQRRKAADAAVKQLRTTMGKDAKPATNGYAKIAQAKRRKASDAAANKLAGRALGRKITAERNVNYKK